MAVQTRTHTVNCENTFAALLVETSSTLIAAPVARPAAANASVRRFRSEGWLGIPEACLPTKD